MPDTGLSRRHFFFGSLLAGAIPAGGYGSQRSLKALGYKSPNEKLNMAAIGSGGQPFADLKAAYADGHENVVALADVDWKRGAAGFELWPKAKRYKDFRQMLDKQGNEIDAIVIGTPDHMHAYCAVACMQLGKHIYVEKPLTRTPWEARTLTQAAAKYGVATQMGNQGYSHDATRVACEMIWSGEIGDITEVHAWSQLVGYYPSGMTKIPPPTPIPDTLNWDGWLGVASDRPFTDGDEAYRKLAEEQSNQISRFMAAGTDGFGFYLPFNWRGFHDFGTGQIGDWGLHILGPANWALQLDPKYLISVECVLRTPLAPYTYPDEAIVKYEFGARPGMPPVDVYWGYGEKAVYLPPGMTVDEARKTPDTGPQVGPRQGEGGFYLGGASAGPTGVVEPSFGYNCVFVGSGGYLGTAGRGEEVGLLPGSRWAGYKLPAPYLPRSPGASTGSNHDAHLRDWVRACKGGAPACSQFSVAGPFTEWITLGLAAMQADGKLTWDNAKGEFTNNNDPQVTQFVKPAYRQGWELKL